MSHRLLSSFSVRASAGALCLLLVAAGTGFIPVAGLSPKVAATPSVVVAPIEPVAVAPQPYVGPRPPIAAPSIKAQGRATQAGVSLTATLSQAQIVRSGDGVAYLHCAVKVDEAPRDTQRQPVDLVLVIDTSGSMVSAMPLLKRATLGIVERLRPEDRLTIVTYSNSARVIFQGATEGEAQAQLEAAVSGLIASGGTNISAGIEAGLASLRPRDRVSSELETLDGGDREAPARRHRCVGEPRPALPAARRILLMTDGLANQGVTDPMGLSGLVSRLRAEGIALSAMGLGNDYNEQLLGSLADAGGGAYHYVDRPESLGAVYSAEVESLRNLVVTGATLTITPKAGAVVEEVVSWSRTDARGSTVVRLGDLAQGRALKVVARLRLPVGTSAASLDVADVQLAFRDVATRTDQRCSVGGLSVGLTDDAQVAKESERAEIRDDLLAVRVARQLKKAREEALAGRGDEARRLVRKLKAVTGKSQLEFEAPSGEMQRLDLDDMADGFAEGASSERGRRAFKQGDAAARTTAR